MSADGDRDREDQIAARVEAADLALAAGEAPTLTDLDSDSTEAFSVLLAAHATLRFLERVWPRSALEPAQRDESDRNAAPTVFGRFRVIKEVGRGGFGVVFLAIDPELNRPIALKLPLADSLLKAEIRHRFVREAQAAAALDHPNLVPLYEAGEIDSICYLASAFCDGPTLSAWLRDQQSAVSPRVAAQMIADMANAVQHSHDRGVLHRDLKPSNVIMDSGRLAWSGGDEVPGVPLESASLSSNPGDLARVNDASDTAAPSRSPFDAAPVPRIVDFGLARLMVRPGEETTASFAAMGSAAYMAPEQAEGKKVGPAADIYSLGAILYVLLCNRPPHRGSSDLDTLRRVVSDDPVAPRAMRRDVPRDLEAICLKCLKKVPAHRYASALELSQDLSRFLAGETPRARPTGQWERLRRKIKQMPAGVTALAIVVTSVVLLLAVQQRYQKQLNIVSRQAREELARKESQQIHLNYSRKIRQADELVRKLRGTAALQILETLRPRPGEEDLREFTWYHLLERCQSQQQTLTGHRGDVYQVAYSPRGDLLASSGKDGTVRVWSTSSWELVRRIEVSAKEVNAGVFSTDGQALATVDDEGKLKLWEIATGTKLLEAQAHAGDAVIALFSSDGNTIITGGRNDGMLKFWNRAGFEEGKLVVGKGPLETAAVSPDGSILATGGTEGVKLWDLPGRKFRAVLSRVESAQAIVFSHDGTKLAASFESGRLISWDIPGGAIAREYSGSYAGMFGAVFSSDAKTISSGDHDGVIRHWDTLTGQLRGIDMGHAGRVWSLAFAPGTNTIASAGQDGTVRFWDGEGSREFFRLGPASAGPVGFADGGRTVLALDGDKGWSIARWNARTGEFLNRRSIGPARGPHYNRFTNDGQSLLYLDTEGTLDEWDTQTGRWQTTVAPQTGKFTFLEISPNDRYVMLVESVPVARCMLWDRLLRRLITLPRDDVQWILFAASGQPILVLRSGDLVWWDPVTGRTAAPTRDSHVQKGEPIVSPDGRLICVIAPGRRTIYLVTAHTLDLVMEIPPQPAQINSAVFSPDGKTLALICDDRVVRLLSTGSGEELIGIEGLGQTIYFVQFAPDGKTFLTVSTQRRDQGGEYRLWRAAAHAR